MGQVRTDKWGPGMPGDYLADYHVRTVEACVFNLPLVGLFPRHHTYAELGSLRAGWARRQTSHVIT